MDTLIEKPSLKEQLQKNYKKIGIIVGAVVIVFWVLGNIFGHSVNADNIRIATVKQGDFISNVEGSGFARSSNIQPFYSPIDSYIKQVFKKEGQFVRAGDTILIVDTSELDKTIQEVQNTVSIDQSNLESKRLEFKSLEINNKKNREIYENNKEMHAYELEAAKKLQTIGALSESEVKVKEAQLKRDEIDIKYLEESQAVSQNELEQQIKTLELQIAIKKNDLAYNRKLKDQTIVRAKSDGVVATQVFTGGEKVQPGTLLAQMNDDSSFFIEAQFSQREINKLRVGQKAQVKYNDEFFPGRLTILNSEIKDGFGAGEIEFEGNKVPDIKQNQRVQVYVETAYKSNTLTVERGSFLQSGGNIAFVVRDNTAYKTLIKVGSVSNTEVEILSGLKAGDRIIVSRIDNYINWDEFKLD
ncbi:MAG: efflux RND transporter periplasmic adaptor subunit [Calditrichaeota bacterium]|nr:efflux RND transporter periplasmic adaptor subunit [Calditrichota bacterium]